jgi:hypothetical protein
MMLESVGNVGFITSALMFVLFTFLFLFSVRWWTDALGRMIAAVLTTVVLIMCLASMVVLGVPLPGINWWRAFLYGILALVLGFSNGFFIWAQFLAPRIRRRRATPSADRSGDVHKEEVHQ